MTADNKFAARLRELSKAARERWTDRPSLRPDIHVPFRNEQQVELWYALRNAADRLADLVERVEAYRAAWRLPYGHGDALSFDEVNAVFEAQRVARGAIFAALDALVADAPGAASGTESPPRMNGDAP